MDGFAATIFFLPHAIPFKPRRVSQTSVSPTSSPHHHLRLTFIMIFLQVYMRTIVYSCPWRGRPPLLRFTEDAVSGISNCHKRVLSRSMVLLFFFIDSPVYSFSDFFATRCCLYRPCSGACPELRHLPHQERVLPDQRLRAQHFLQQLSLRCLQARGDVILFGHLFDARLPYGELEDGLGQAYGTRVPSQAQAGAWGVRPQPQSCPEGRGSPGSGPAEHPEGRLDVHRRHSLHDRRRRRREDPRSRHALGRCLSRFAPGR